MINLYEHQLDAIERLRSGSILVGGTGSGKTRTAIAYYYLKECGGKIEINGSGGYSPMKRPKDLYVITTAINRDHMKYEKECLPFCIFKEREISESNVKLFVDSWNNIEKYKDVTNAFFIFDEQRVVGSGKWSKMFIKIAKKNRWILLSATPGDTWMDYCNIFIANGFYRNRTEFINKHVVYSRYTKYRIDHYEDCDVLVKYRKRVVVEMLFRRQTTSHKDYIFCDYDKKEESLIVKNRWNPYEDRPIESISELCYLLRKNSNVSEDRFQSLISDILLIHDTAIIFYNFDYELDMLRTLSSLGYAVGEWNGHNHDPIPSESKWLYLVQYYAGAEGWDCRETDTTIFYSMNYSYKMMTQAEGRIDRMDTDYSDLYYYYMTSYSRIDKAIMTALKNKRNFNEYKFLK